MERFLAMKQRDKGFSLLESLVTLLVLSIGMLALGQLQARLWVNSSNTYRAELALLTAKNAIKLIEFSSLITNEPALPRAPLPAFSPPGFHHELSVVSDDVKTTAEVQVVWQTATAPDSTTLQTRYSSNFLAEDAIWLTQNDQ
jgi:prepilin-type N-terminal cleavage/methylation domain-containing protein